MIDAHLHIHPGFSTADLMQYLDREKLEGCWLLTWEEMGPVPWPYLDLNIETVYEAFLEFPERIVPMYAPDPHRPDCVARFRHYYRKGIRGCAELKSALNWKAPQIQPLLETVNELALPLVLHMEQGRKGWHFKSPSRFEAFLEKSLSSERFAGLPRRTIESVAALYPPLREKLDGAAFQFPGYLMDFAGLEAAIRQYPDIRFVGHGPTFWQGISGETPRSLYPRGVVNQPGPVQRLLEQYPNFYADLSGRSGFNALNRDRHHARRFLDQFASKLLFGTDNYFAGLKTFLESLGLSDRALRQIFSDNANRLIRL
ncbi:MAG TPA: amidohydrolase family protein [Calditrichia bacterium]|nr:amidohydrolase family protein [Calditrichia bacterium]